MTHRLHGTITGALVALLSSGCVLATDTGDGELCAADPSCPAGYSCVDGSCVLTGGDGDGSGGGDGDSDGDGDGDDDPLPTGYAYRVQLTFDNADRGELDDVPVLVTLAEEFDYAAVRPDGGDVEFRDGDGTLLSHDVDSWESGGISSIWVRVPRIDGATTTDFIWMYYGDAEAAATQDADGVWTAYDGVYHMGGGEIVADSSARQYDGTPVGTTPVGGMIGGARNFNGTSDYIDLGTDRDFGRAASGVTMEGWVEPGTVVAAAVAFGVAINGGTASRIQIRAQANAQLEGGARTADGGDLLSADGDPMVAATWLWVAVAMDFAGDTITIYYDGEPVVVSTPVGFAPTTPDTASSQAVIGADENLIQNFWLGSLDEVRISNDAKSADWVAAQYASMTGNLISFGTPELL